jgi:transposase
VGSYCAECFKEQRQIDRLRAENDRLKQALHYRRAKEQEGLFGSSTPSAKLPVKANTKASESSRKRGAQPGHPAHLRQRADPAQADRVVAVPSAYAGRCPQCGGALENKGMRRRLVRECRPIESEEIVFELPVEYCSCCARTLSTPAPAVFPKAVLGNQLLTNAVEMSYLHGIPLGRVCEQLEVGPGALVGMYHRLANLLHKVPEKLVEKYRQAPVKHADETGWRTNGKNGYAWLFATSALSIFQFEKTRASRVAKAVFGDKPLPGVLVVDRYAGYNKAPCAIQYCLAHLLREVHDAEKEFPDSIEVKSFVATVAPLLALAIGLRAQNLSGNSFQKKATQVAAELKEAMASPAQHLAIRRIQDIFVDNEPRLYHWARDRMIPADNNLAERDLRPTVIARKTSFGSQSDAGAKTRGILMTIFHTLKKQGGNPAARFKAALDSLARDPTQDPFALLFPAFTPT